MKKVEEIINEWNDELKKDVKEFYDMASEVYKWDSELLKEEEIITELVNRSKVISSEQQSLKTRLEWIQSQQESLEGFLTNLERSVAPLARQSLVGSDAYRHDTYETAERMNRELDQINEAVVGMQDTVTMKYNEALRSSRGPSETAMTEIVKLLDLHLQSLQRIDEEGDRLEQEMKNVKSQMSK